MGRSLVPEYLRVSSLLTNSLSFNRTNAAHIYPSQSEVLSLGLCMLGFLLHVCLASPVQGDRVSPCLHVRYHQWVLLSAQKGVFCRLARAVSLLR